MTFVYINNIPFFVNEMYQHFEYDGHINYLGQLTCHNMEPSWISMTALSRDLFYYRQNLTNVK